MAWHNARVRLREWEQFTKWRDGPQRNARRESLKMSCREIPIEDVCAELAQLYGIWSDITGDGTYDLAERGYSPLMPLISHRASVFHVAASNDPMDWIMQAYTSDFDVLSNHSYVGRRLGVINSVVAALHLGLLHSR